MLFLTRNMIGALVKLQTAKEISCYTPCIVGIMLPILAHGAHLVASLHFSDVNK